MANDDATDLEIVFPDVIVVILYVSIEWAFAFTWRNFPKI